MDESSNNALYADMKARIALTYKLFFFKDGILIVPQLPADKSQKVNFTTNTALLYSYYLFIRPYPNNSVEASSLS